ncbi:MAG TPA: GAF domain-containing protein, partial [Polyangiaceae bacterium]|nr:GAF domain-containing protein [Polyangiaceae bacterium]
FIEENRHFSPDASFPAARAFRSGEPEWVENEAEYARRYPSLASHPETRSCAAAALPLVLDGRVIAVAAFRFDEPRTFDDEERAVMVALGSQAAQAFQRAQLEAREALARHWLEALGGLASALSTVLTRSEVVEVVVERGMKTAGADTCTIYVFDEDKTALTLIGDRGVSRAIVDQIRFIRPESGNPVLSTLQTGKPIWAETEADYMALYPALVTHKAEGPRARAFWSFPLISEGRSFGLLGMGFYAPRAFSAEERKFVQTFCHHCSEALRRAERFETERAARAAAERLQGSLETTLRSIGDAVIATDASGRVALMNPIAESLTGWSESESRGKPLTEVFPIFNEQTRKEVESPVDKVLREGRVVGLANHTVLLSRDGTREIPIEDSGAPIRGPDQTIQGVVLVFRDASVRRREEIRRSFLAQAAAVLSESLDYQTALAQVAKLAVPEVADWCTVDVLEEGQSHTKQLAMAHIDPAKVQLARELAEKYPPDPKAATGVPNVLRTGRSELYSDVPESLLEAGARDAEHLRILRELRLRSGMIVPLIARGKVLGAMTFVYADANRRYAEDDLEFAETLAQRCAVAIDNARLYAAETRARKNADLASEAKDEFLATVSHELRTPLTAIMGWAKLLASPVLNEAKRSRALETIDRNTVAMAELIDDLLDMSRIVSGRLRIDRHAVDLAHVLRSAIDSIAPTADAKQIRITPLFDADSAVLAGDPGRLQQVFWNLLSNAVKFTPRGGSVDVVLQRVDLSAEIRVTDSGRGIAPDFLPYIFDPFRQEDATSTRARGGLGLGLAIARRLVELHGGNIAVQSHGDGRGATFTVTLPLSAVAATMTDAQDSARAVTKARDLSGIHVLVVDDHADARDLIRAVLETSGAKVDTAGDVDEAMLVFTQRIPDVLISDIGMPGQDGYDLIGKIRKLPAERGGGVPAAALSAYARTEDRRRALNAGYSMHLAKPIEPGELIDVVASLTRFASGSLAPSSPKA